jgi:hypothetical protein
MQAPQAWRRTIREDLRHAASAILKDSEQPSSVAASAIKTHINIAFLGV